jgi:hypothetical protein
MCLCLAMLGKFHIKEETLYSIFPANVFESILVMIFTFVMQKHASQERRKFREFFLRKKKRKAKYIRHEYSLCSTSRQKHRYNDYSLPGSAFSAAWKRGLEKWRGSNRLHYLSNASSSAKMDRAAGARARTPINKIKSGRGYIGVRQGGPKEKRFPRVRSQLSIDYYH